MAISLLYRDGSKPGVRPTNKKLLYHLSLDRSFSYICRDEKKRQCFLALLSSQVNDKEEMIYRQEIVKDFQKNPSLLEQLTSMYVRFEELILSQQNANRDEYRLNASSSPSAVALQGMLQTQVLCLKRALLFVKGFGELLAKYDLQSVGLNAFYDACRGIYEKPEFSELLTFCAKYEYFSMNSFLDFKFVLNESGRISNYELINHKYIHVTDPDAVKKGFSFFKKTEEKVYPCQRINHPSMDGFYDTLAVSALSDLSKLFSGLSKQIFAQFEPIHEELDFYDVALKYINALSEKEIPYCFPTISSDRSIKVTQLYDLYLLMSKKTPLEVVPNDFVMSDESRGLVVFGNNGSGKTVYLRSIGTMQVLAQAGLPVPCESATITPCSQIATQFSEAEKEFCEGNDAVRFEQEVRELAVMVDTLQEDSLVFLNETFQSTAYAEGAEGLYHLLMHFSEMNIRWILVSHLRQLEDRFAPSEATILHTGEGYRVINKLDS